MTDLRQYAPATVRNREPILAVLRRVLPAHGRVLEIASGTGEHAVFFAQKLEKVDWQPSDPDAGARDSIAAWIASAGAANVRAPIHLDVRAADWDVSPPFDAVVSVNMIHIAPWEATLGLIAGAWRLLGEGGVLFLYGPFKREGRHTAPSNEAFELWLKQRDPAFGVRDLSEVEAVVVAHGFRLTEIVEMPANNLSVVFVKT